MKKNIFVLTLLALIVVGCGQKGDLFLEEPQPPVIKQKTKPADTD